MEPSHVGMRVSIKEAARALEYSRTGLMHLVRQGHLTLYKPPKSESCAYFLLPDLQKFAEQARRQRQRITRIDRNALSGYMLPERLPLITTTEAAEMLGVTRNTMNAIIARKKWPHIQVREAHLHNLIPRLWVEALSESKQYRIARERWEKAQTANRPRAGDVGFESVWLTAKEVALCLNITWRQVHYLRRNGRLHGEAFRRKGFPPGPKWHFHINRVRELANDPTYRKGRRAAEKVQDNRFMKAIDATLEMNGWNLPEHQPDYYVPEVW